MTILHVRHFLCVGESDQLHRFGHVHNLYHGFEARRPHIRPEQIEQSIRLAFKRNQYIQRLRVLHQHLRVRHSSLPVRYSNSRTTNGSKANGCAARSYISISWSIPKACRRESCNSTYYSSYGNGTSCSAYQVGGAPHLAATSCLVRLQLL